MEIYLKVDINLNWLSVSSPILYSVILTVIYKLN